MGKTERHYSNKGGHFLRGQFADLEKKALRASPDGRFIRPNEPPGLIERYTARRSMRRITQSGR